MLVVKLTHIPSQQVTSDIPNAEYGRWRQKRIPPFGSHSESKAKKKKKLTTEMPLTVFFFPQQPTPEVAKF